MMKAETISASLQHHWSLDVQASERLAEIIDFSGQADHISSVVEQLDETAVNKRNDNRNEIGDIFTKKSDKSLVVVGPCSIDAHTDYNELLDYIEVLRDENPASVIAMRANSAKPRTAGGWTGLWYSTDPSERSKIRDVYENAFMRGIPVLAEVTQETQLGSLAPWMSGAWIGARDIPSTTLRSAFSAFHLPVGVKNGIDGNPNTVKDTVLTIGRSSAENDDSGVDLGTVASSHIFNGIPTGILPVGEGNKQVSIIARGYELPEGFSAEEGRAATIGYLSLMCTLGSELGSAVLIDGSHSVPKMLKVGGKDPNRIIPVLEEINRAVHNGEVEQAHQLAGLVLEIGTTTGKTDPNFILNKETKSQLGSLIGITVDLISG